VLTINTIELALSKAIKYGIDHIIVASCSGTTAGLLAVKLPIWCMSHANGFKEPGIIEMSQ
jgi:hypothetical protein